MSVIVLTKIVFRVPIYSNCLESTRQITIQTLSHVSKECFDDPTFSMVRYFSIRDRMITQYCLATCVITFRVSLHDLI